MTNHADMSPPREDHLPVDLTQPLMLDVRNPNGDVTVRATDRSDLLIGRVSSSHGDEVELRIDAHGNRIEVRVIPSPGWGGVTGDVDLEAVVGQIARAFRRGGSRPVSQSEKTHIASGGHAWCDLTIEVPREMSGRIEVQTVSGDIRVDDVITRTALNTMSGDVRVHRTTGDLALQSASGDLALEETSGRLTARTASGDVRLTAAQCLAAEIKTASGDIVLDATLTGDGPFRAQTASGDVRLTMRQHTADGHGPAATLAFQTISGDAHITPPFGQRERHRWQAGADTAGGPHIAVTTVSGDLSAGIAATGRPSGSAPRPDSRAPSAANWTRDELPDSMSEAQQAAAPPAAPDSADRLAVLEAVERGDIDIEEALHRLEAADVSASPSESR